MAAALARALAPGAQQLHWRYTLMASIGAVFLLPPPDAASAQARAYFGSPLLLLAFACRHRACRISSSRRRVPAAAARRGLRAGARFLWLSSAAPGIPGLRRSFGFSSAPLHIPSACTLHWPLPCCACTPCGCSPCQERGTPGQLRAWLGPGHAFTEVEGLPRSFSGSLFPAALLAELDWPRCCAAARHAPLPGPAAGAAAVPAHTGRHRHAAPALAGGAAAGVFAPPLPVP